MLETHFESASSDDDVAVIKLNQTFLMNIEGGNTLTFKFKAAHELAEGQEFNFKLAFEFYLKREIGMDDDES